MPRGTILDSGHKIAVLPQISNKIQVFLQAIIPNLTANDQSL